jgi:predicted MPP superfamily phosphohydrolase
MLSGHTHGGQIAPFGIAIKLPHGSGGYVSGWSRDDGGPLYVSRGIGTSLVPIRIGATPELAQFDWSLG